MAIELNEEDIQYNCEDVVITLNGIKINGLSLKDNSIRFKYDQVRYNIYEFINNAIIGVFTNSKIGTCEIDTFVLSKLVKNFISSVLGKTQNVLIISVPNHMTITLTAAGVSDLGTIAIGTAPNEQMITLKGRLDIVPIGI